MKTLYICHTVYQFLIALIKYRSEEDNHLLIIDNVVSSQFLIGELPFTIHHARSSEFGLKGLLSLRRWRQQKSFLSSFDNRYIFLDHREVGAFLHAHALSYQLLEDGLDFFQYQGTDKRQVIYGSWPREFVYNSLMRRPLGPGKSPYCLSIEVNSKQGLQLRDERLQKVREVSRRQLFDQLSEAKRQEILRIFGLTTFEQQLQGILILTQPLVQDRWDPAITTEEEQLAFYRQIVIDYGQGQQVFFKIHPRDQVDYSSLTDVVFLEQRLPMELYELVADCRFSKGITHSSTALDFLCCVDEKIVLKLMK